MEERTMPTIMTKYKYNDNLFLIYNTNLLNNNFSADELQCLSRDIQTDYIIIFNGGKINFYNARFSYTKIPSFVKKQIGNKSKCFVYYHLSL